MNKSEHKCVFMCICMSHVENMVMCGDSCGDSCLFMFESSFPHPHVHLGFYMKRPLEIRIFVSFIRARGLTLTSFKWHGCTTTTRTEKHAPTRTHLSKGVVRFRSPAASNPESSEIRGLLLHGISVGGSRVEVS